MAIVGNIKTKRLNTDGASVKERRLERKGR